MLEPIVTAIVSTYASARYMRGCLEDLLDQTIADRIEILVVDACSPEGEARIVREFQRSHANIRYVRTEQRVGTSEAFNRATEMARGRYLTTANTDDRHRPDFFARMVQALEERPQFGLVYADSLITHRDNDTFAETDARVRYGWPDFTLTTALSCCLFGAQPVWRKSVHERAGLWDVNHRCANDQDMFLRIAHSHGAVHLREPLGLFLMRPDSVSGADHRGETLAEVLEVLRRYRTSIPLEDLFPQLRECPDDPLARAAALFELGNLCSLSPYTDAALALDCYREALELPVGPAHVTAVRTAYANNSAAILLCAGAVGEASKALTLAGPRPEAVANRARLAVAGDAPPLTSMAFAQIDHPVVTASRTTRSLVIADDGALDWTAPHQQLPWDVYDGPNGVPVRPGEKLWSFPAAPDTAEPIAAQPAPAPHLMMVMYGWADSGGGTMLPRQIALELARRGQRVSVVHAAAQPDPAVPPYGVRRSSEAGVELFAICNRPTSFLDLQAPLREVDDPKVRETFGALLDELQPDVVHFFNLHNLGMSLPAEAKYRGLPTLLTSNNYWPICPRLYLIDERLQACDGSTSDGAKCGTCVNTPAADQATRKAAGVEMLNGTIDLHLAVSHRVRDLYVQHGQDPHKIEVLRQEPPQVAELWARAGSVRPIVNRLDRPLRVAYIGSVLPHKGVHVLAQALQQFVADGSHSDCDLAIECVVLGDAQQDYLQWLQQLDRHQTLHFAGAYRQDLLHQYLALVDVVVVPSIWDDCAPFVVAEALAARAPVLGSRIGGIPDFVRHGENGFLFAPGDADDLARCLRHLLDDHGLLGQMQRAIRAPRGLRAHVDDLCAAHARLAPCAAESVPAT